MHLLVAGAFALASLPLVAWSAWRVARLAWGALAPSVREPTSPASVHRGPS
jgi:hypothetical protein